VEDVDRYPETDFNLRAADAAPDCEAEVAAARCVGGVTCGVVGLFAGAIAMGLAWALTGGLIGELVLFRVGMGISFAAGMLTAGALMYLAPGPWVTTDPEETTMAGRPWKFDAAGLAAEETKADAATAAAPGDRETAAEMFAAEVHGRLEPDVRGRMAAIDPGGLITLIANAIISIIQACKQKPTRAALEAYRARPGSLRSIMLRHRIARRFPPALGDDRHALATGIVENGVRNLDSELWAAAFPAGEESDQ
jgi:hypothetical protein